MSGETFLDGRVATRAGGAAGDDLPLFAAGGDGPRTAAGGGR